MTEFPVVTKQRFWPTRLNELLDYDSYQVEQFLQGVPNAKVLADKVIRVIEYPFYHGQPDDTHVWNAFHGKWCKTITLDFWQKASETAAMKIGDCLFPDTPVVVLKPPCPQPDLVEVADLVPRDLPIGSKYYPEKIYILSGHHRDYKSSSTKFYPVNWILKKTSAKARVRISTGRSVFDVTEDHPILCKGDGSRREFHTPAGTIGKVIWKTELPFEVFGESYRLDDEIEYDLPWVYGLFAAEGSCGRGWWRIRNTDEKLLERAKNILEYCFENRVGSDGFRSIEFEIIEEAPAGAETNLGVRNKPLLALVARAKRNGKGCAKARGSLLRFTELWRSRCYTSLGNKRVPHLILNGSKKMAEGFIDGFNAGDAGTTTSKILAFGLVILYRKLGIDARVHDHGKNLELYIANSKAANKRGTSKSIRYLDGGGTNRIVFDLNIPSPHIFVAGDVFVHNCEDSSILGVAGSLRLGKEAYEVFGYVEEWRRNPRNPEEGYWEVVGGHGWYYVRDPDGFGDDKFHYVESTLDVPPKEYPVVEDIRKPLVWGTWRLVPEIIWNDKVFETVNVRLDVQGRVAAFMAKMRKTRYVRDVGYFGLRFREKETRRKYVALSKMWGVKTKPLRKAGLLSRLRWRR